MHQSDTRETLARIAQMEECFEALSRAADTHPFIIPEKQLRLLKEYYQGGQWLEDYEMDEQGRLPPDLKRGVLSQDGIYNLLERLKEISENESYGVLPL